ncbi:uncharacterized protein PITG_21842 [Phytophthora infestans T30-4]|uniref:RPA-interacting protein C-terminal domain-containing protein n=1 Tax=Phytophthora infestans (strain T30-4) TaxID=403677 RepID=D0P4K3_PHYIT|nr:uncharacterized protein PITG_21842 [Phytophthora infestans T30-4]EEY66892.1 conserved hypothetical protein [Phytophthora infestans T30-4]|eukprot:XP_002894771.1 conserved hypothetical protein [Phytophthora infestans T30-4]
MPPPPAHRSPIKRLSLSPPVWKDQLRQRCLQRLKRDRSQLLAKLRRPVDDLLLMGRLKESDYLEIIHTLEDALRLETEMDTNEDEQLRLAEHMAELEDAELEAMLAKQQQELISVLCPICKAGYLREHASTQMSTPFISCGCGFTFHVKYVYHSVLEDFQDKIVNAFMTHRDSCCADPTFEKKTTPDNGADVLCIKCAHCGSMPVLP